MGIFSKKVVAALEGLSDCIKSDNVSYGDLIQFIRGNAATRRDRLEIYSNMVKDGVIDSAIEMIADDVTIPEEDTGKVVWVESNNKTVQNVLQFFLDSVLEIDKNLWSWVYQLIFNGDLYINTFYSDYVKAIDEHQKRYGTLFHVLREKDTYRIYHLAKKGKSEGFFVADVDEDGRVKGKGILYPKEQFVHMYIDKNVVTKITDSEDKLEVNLLYDKGEEGKFDIVQGTSYLEQAVQPWKILRILEDVLVMYRLSKSAYFQLVSVEVGNATKKETTKIINDVKDTIQRKEVIGQQVGGYYKSINNPTPLGQFVYIPTRGGKGEIKVENIAQDVNIKDIVDIEYFRNKLFAALKVPKAFLGQEGDLPGGIGDTSLTRIGIQYGRTVNRFKTIVKNGIKDLCLLYLDRCEGFDFVTQRDFTIQMAKTSSAEEEERATDRESRMNYASNLVSMMEDNFQGMYNKEELMNYVLYSILRVNSSTFKLTQGVDENEEGSEEAVDEIDTAESDLSSEDQGKEEVVMDKEGWVRVEPRAKRNRILK